MREETDGGRSIVRFFRQVVEGERDSEGFQPNHKMDSAKELVKIGLTEFAGLHRRPQRLFARSDASPESHPLDFNGQSLA